MGYIKDLYGSRNKDFINGFLAAMEVYSLWRNGKQRIGFKELKTEQRKAIIELGGNPKEFEIYQ